jgi:hypothetical protein
MWRYPNDTPQETRAQSISCRCGDSNENCAFCFGRGSVQRGSSLTTVPSFHIDVVPASDGHYKSKADVRLGTTGLHTSDTSADPSFLQRAANTRRPKKKREPEARAIHGVPSGEVGKHESQVTRIGFTVCSRCGCSLLLKRLDRYFKKVHASLQEYAQSPHAQNSEIPNRE